MDTKTGQTHEDTTSRKSGNTEGAAEGEEDILTVFLEEVKFSTTDDGKPLTPKTGHDSARTTDLQRSNETEDAEAQEPKTPPQDTADVADSVKNQAAVSKTDGTSAAGNTVARLTECDKACEPTKSAQSPVSAEVSVKLESDLNSPQTQPPVTADSDTAETLAASASDNAAAISASGRSLATVQELAAVTSDVGAALSPGLENAA
ncbi:hypothetical protein ACOMHN_022589 [Nucella lapillus]